MGVVHWNKAAGTFLIFMVFTGLAPTRARADGFAWYDDPNSAFLAFSNSVSGNDLLFTIPVQNTGAAHDIALLIPLFDVLDNTQTQSLAWNQAQNGWSGTVNGNPLLVTITSPEPHRVWFCDSPFPNERK